MLLKKITRFLKKEDGQSFVEFALVLPILITILSLTFDLVRIIDTKIVLNNATGEMARTFALQIEGRDNSEQHVIQTVKQDFSGRLDVKKMEVTISNPASVSTKYNLRGCFLKHADQDGYCEAGQEQQKEKEYKYKEVEVSIRYKVDIIMPLSKILFGESVTASSRFVTKVGVKP